MLATFSRVTFALTLIAGLCAPQAFADDDDNTFKARLEGYQEVPAVSSPGSGRFKAKLEADGATISYELTYDGLQGVPFMSHIHLGQQHTNGGIMVWLCGNAPAVPPADTPACPVPGGTVTGMIQSAQVVGPATQLLGPGEFAEVVKAMKSGAAYVNVHTDLVRSGEIRGQVKARD